MSSPSKKKIPRPAKSLFDSIGYVFGSPMESFENLNNLPTFKDVGSRLMAICDTERVDYHSATSTIKLASSQVAKELIQVWESHSDQPIKSLRAVQEKIINSLIPNRR